MAGRNPSSYEPLDDDDDDDDEEEELCREDTLLHIVDNIVLNHSV